MKHLTDTIREALSLALTWHDAKYEHPFIKQALTALSEIERMAGEPVPVIYQRRMRPSWRPEDKHPWTCWDECSKGEAEDCWKTPLLHDWLHEARALYLAPPAQQSQYEAGDMASAHNDGFRAGVASVAQQPQADLLAAAKEFCRKVDAGEARSTTSYAAFKLAIERIEKQPQAEKPLAPIEPESIDAAMAKGEKS